MPVLGQCKLCGLDQAALQDSHIVPKWAYKRIRGKAIKGNPHPMHVKDKRAVTTSMQVTDFLLCSNCEQRIGRVDHYVSTQCLQTNGTVPLREAPQVIWVSDDRNFALLDTSSLELDALCRFAISVIWRAHVSAMVPQIDLGTNAESIRAYLSGETDYPSSVHVAVQTYVEPDGHGSLADHTIILPESHSNGDATAYWFLVCGLHFEVSVGIPADESILELCLHCGQTKGVLVGSWRESGAFQNLVVTASEALQARRR